jgi:hypothetical protein
VRAWIAAVVGGVAGAAAAAAFVALQPDAPAESSLDTSALTREIASLRDRLDRIERTAVSRSRPAVEPSAPPEEDDEYVHVGGWNRHSGRGSGRERPPAVPEAPPDLSKVSSEDLALEADDRHTHEFDISGAAKRYLELLSRATTPSDRRHWSIRLGDCYVRLNMQDKAMQAYRDCVDASTEDHDERVACMIALARHARASDPEGARRWIDRAFDLERGRTNSTARAMSADLARDAKDTPREMTELEWLVANAQGDVSAWTERLAGLRGERR